MFECKINAGQFKRIIESMTELISECTCDVTQSELRIVSMDSSHVALVHVSLSCGGFLLYDCQTPTSFGFRPKTLLKLIKPFANEGTIQLRYNHGDAELLMLFESPSGDRVSHSSMKLVDIDQEDLNIPPFEHETKITMPSLEIKQMFKDFQAIGDVLNISCNKEGVCFEVDGVDGSMNTIIAFPDPSAVPANGNETIIDMKKACANDFSLKYLNYFVKATAAEQVSMELITAQPMKFSYPLGEIGFVSFYLAPKIEE